MKWNRPTRDATATLSEPGKRIVSSDLAFSVVQTETSFGNASLVPLKWGGVGSGFVEE